MKLRKYEALTEQDAMKMVKDDLGSEAIILNIKKTLPRGLKSIFRKPLVEITAAYDDKASPLKKVTDIENTITIDSSVIAEQEEKIKDLEKKLVSTEDMLQKAVKELTIMTQSIKLVNKKFKYPLIQIFYDSLVEQGVTTEIAEKILGDLAMVKDIDSADISVMVKVVYNTIIDIIGNPSIPVMDSENQEGPLVLTFIGPTGVGKTTTIAKLSSIYILNYNKSVGLLTADTYRIAAIEQLKTYAEILNIEVKVVYDNLELIDNIIFMGKENDVILIDTAGRSHKNDGTMEDLKDLLLNVEGSEKFLVLSLTTKYEDMLNIVNKYQDITDFRLIFTKFDETTSLGSLLNICYTTKKKVAYITTGQSVPDDIEVMSPEKIARSLLGLGGDD